MLNAVAVQGHRHNEEPETRNLSKSQLYKILAATFVLPASDSRAVSRSYLLRVRRDQVFRIDRHELLQFEADLEVRHHTKKGYHNLTILLERFAMLLEQLGFRELGFTPGNYPEESWVYRAVRFTDRSNILDVYRLPVPNAVEPDILSTRV